MDQRDHQVISLIGFSTTGKSTVGRKAAALLGWQFVDTDDLVVEMAGKPIPAIFAEDGEDHFRELEHQAITEALEGRQRIVATGGGAILREENRELMEERSVVICLEARPATIFARLTADGEGKNPVARPLLSGPDPLTRIEFLKEYRQPFYAIAHWTIHTDTLSHDEVASEIVRCWRYLSRKASSSVDSHPGPFANTEAREAEAPYCEESGAACVVRTPTVSYPVFIGWGTLDELGRRMRNAGLKGTAHLISDGGVFPLWGDRVEAVLREAGFEVDSFCVPAGEASKSLAVATGIFDWLVERRAERGHPVVALGGGVVGDLAGFVAATYLRGMPFVQVPTTLLAMVDSSIGGKTGVNHREGKNLIGAFYQPRLVLTDVQTLSTLPQRELVSGWAEVVKHALILDAPLFDRLEASIDRLLQLDPDASTEIIARSAAIKAGVVTQDEKETGLRTILNYGHTMAHAVEAATTYGTYLHGEAVAIGMTGAALISHRLGLIPVDVVERQRALLEKLGLPTAYTGADKGQLLTAITLDKKVSGKSVRWVLLNGIGEAVVRSDVPADLVDQVLDQLTDIVAT
ncbi:MAG: 3-dehydroquinate synthase [Chloroflexi bacterium]|nr:3-dehydroquinate synthase [Chloroflexota bacterium]